jgi:uncharacterized protein (TIGR02246 family)
MNEWASSAPRGDANATGRSMPLKSESIREEHRMGAEDEIRELLEMYESSLNKSDAHLAAACYASDGVFMPTMLPTVVGPQMRDAYAQIFETIRLNVNFAIDELVVATDDLAYALTRSNGTQTVLASGAESAESNREIFVFRAEDGAWKIARYMFNKSGS